MRFSLYEYSLNGFWPFLAIITALPESQRFTLWPLATAASASLNEKSRDIEPTSEGNTPNVKSAMCASLRITQCYQLFVVSCTLVLLQPRRFLIVFHDEIDDIAV